MSRVTAHSKHLSTNVIALTVISYRYPTFSLAANEQRTVTLVAKHSLEYF